MQLIKLSKLIKDGLQTRVALNEQTVTDYADSIRNGAKFPPVTVVKDGSKYYLADGFHRVEATSRAGKINIEANVKEGKFIDALRIALMANADHGLRRTNADKRRTLEIAWENRQDLFGGDPTAPLLAKACKVHENTARLYLQEVQPLQNVGVHNSAEGVDNSETGTKTAAKAVGAPPTARPRVVAPAPVRRVGVDGKLRTVPVPKRPIPVLERPVAVPVPKHAPGVIVDRFGVEVPTAIRGAFTDVTLDEVAHHISVARSMIRRMKDEKNPAYMQLSDSASIELDNAFREVRFAKPYCVCRMCQGDGCKACGEAGFQTEAQYGNNPKEYKAE